MVAIALLLGTSTVAGAESEADSDPETEATDPEDEVAQRTSEPGAEDELDELENLVVTTGRRRQEFLQETPVSATVLSGSLLEERGVNSLEEVGVFVPNLTAFSGVQHQGSFYARGVGQRDAIVTLDPGVGIYVDDVYIARGHGSLLPTLDLERLEVLRGPQGTLYGKNTIGGAVKLITEKPGPEPAIGASLGGGSFDAIESSAMLNAPLLDDLLYSRFNFASRDDEGYTRNSFNGDRYNDDNLLATRGAFRLLPHEYVTLDLTGHWSKEKEEGHAAKCRISDPATAAFIPPLAAACAAAENRSTYRFATNRDEKYRIDSYGTALTADWEVGPALDLGDLGLKSITSWQEQRVDDGFLDLDATELPLVEMATVDSMRQTQVSQEIQATTGMFEDRVKLTSGVYGFWEETNGGDILSNSFGTIRQERVEIDNSSYAAYTQSSYTPLEWVELTGGVRWTYEDKAARRTIVFGGSPGELPVERASRSFDQWTPMAGVAFRAPESLLDPTPVRSGLVYFTYAQGYKSGGFSTRRNPALLRISEFASEELDNFEVGVKLDFWDSRLQLNTALFYSKYDDIQLTVLRVNPASPSFQPDMGSSIANAGEATIKGLEIEATTRLFDALTIRTSLGLTDAEYDEFIDQTFDLNLGTGQVENIRELDRSGEEFFNVPSLSFDATVEYALELANFGLPRGGTLTPLVHVYYQDAIYSHLTADGFASGRFRQKPYTLLDLRLIYDLCDDRTQLTFFVNNVAGTKYFDSAVDLTDTLGIGSVYYAAPQTFGGEIRYRWTSPTWF